MKKADLTLPRLAIRQYLSTRSGNLDGTMFIGAQEIDDLVTKTGYNEKDIRAVINHVAVAEAKGRIATSCLGEDGIVFDEGAF